MQCTVTVAAILPAVCKSESCRYCGKKSQFNTDSSMKTEVRFSGERTYPSGGRVYAETALLSNGAHLIDKTVSTASPVYSAAGGP